MNAYQFDIDKICDYLEPLKDNLPTLYQWSARMERLEELSVFAKGQVAELYGISSYERELVIKKTVNAKLHEHYQKKDKKYFYDLCLWIIKDWGGILTANDDNTVKVIEAFLKSEKPSYTRIASASKIGSFMHPDKNIIYDSRVAYSLNWILLSQTNNTHFFPIPNGRNSKMKAFDMDVLIRLKHIENYQVSIENDSRQFISKRDKKIYIPANEAYYELNKLITQVNHKLWSDDMEKKEKLFYTEMLLFSIADRQIYDEITKRVKVFI